MTLTATLSMSAGPVTGTVQFYDGATLLGSAIPFFQAYIAAQRKHGPEPLFPCLRTCSGGGAAISDGSGKPLT